ncbi:hypothetical protein F5Y16DRAFT_399097 [Xylariaceae sp. FL0255]|nr:hypothetical protein F5Y16DRAFT_399097 [Xylariaceae sp. FL0255]
MRTSSVIFTILSVSGSALAGLMPRQYSSSASATPTTTGNGIPCPTNPPTCVADGGRLVCLASTTWCEYTGARGSPAFFPVNLTAPCADCLPSMTQHLDALKTAARSVTTEPGPTRQPKLQDVTCRTLRLHLPEPPTTDTHGAIGFESELNTAGLTRALRTTFR